MMCPIKGHLCQDVDIFALTPMHALPGAGVCSLLSFVCRFVCSPFPCAHTHTNWHSSLWCILHLFPLLFPWLLPLPLTSSVPSSLASSAFTSPLYPPVDANPSAYIFLKWLHLRIDAQMRTKAKVVVCTGGALL